jgi:hypothetical protein
MTFIKFPVRTTPTLLHLILEDEVKKVVFQMEHNKAPRPDGFPAEFYQNFWDVNKSNLMQLFGIMHVGQLDLFLLNFVR